MASYLIEENIRSLKKVSFVICFSLITLSFLLATYSNKAVSDYNFYSNKYNHSLSRFIELSKNHNDKYIASNYSPLAYLLSDFNLLKFSKDAKEDFYKFLLSDTTKQDTTKKKNNDSLSQTTQINLLIQDTTKKIKRDSLGLSDSTKTIDSLLKTVEEKIDSFPGFDAPFASAFDSLLNIDTTALHDTSATKGYKKIEILDSTARIQHFQYKFEDKPFSSYYKESIHPLFGNTKASTTYGVRIDSSTNMVIVTENLNGIPIRFPIWIPIDEYIKMSQNFYTQLGWEEKARKYEFKKKDDKVEIGSLLSNITNLDIPIPENPLMSIFGDRSRINLRITGAVDIRGAFRNQKTEGMTISKLGNSRNEPDFKQNVSIQVDGTVGDKLSIGANWDTQNQFDYMNQLRIGYRGYEDEIIQSIDAGNVGITTNSALVGSTQALFGIKAQMNIGPLKLTTVASQKKSEKKEISLTGGSQKSQFEFRAFQYSTSHFFIDPSYRDTWYAYYGNAIAEVNSDLRVLEIEVWVTRPGSIEKPEEREVVADIDLPELPISRQYNQNYQTRNVVPGTIEVGRFEKLRSDQFILHEYTGFITLNVSIQQNQAIAVAYKTQGGKTFGYFSNDIDTTQKRIVLKLIKPGNLIPDFKKAWSMQLKNIYSIGGRGIKKETLSNVKMYINIPGQPDQDNLQGIPLLEILGLDKTDEAQTGGSDGKFDYFEGRTIDPLRGEIIFPNLEPFRDCFLTFKKDGKTLDSASSYVFSEVYDTTLIYAQQNMVKNRFVMKGEYSGSASSTYRLPGLSVVPGSVKVFLDGNELSMGSDFIIDEIGGQVIIKKEEALLPNAALQIKYEENDLMSFSSKTLLGATGELNIGKSTKLGFGWINSVQQTLSDKVRLGEEPINNSIFGVNWSSSFDLPFITSSLNYFPFFSSNEQSSISLRGEAAYILPDPNTKKSTIPIDDNEGVAYIDDFEGSRQYIPLGVNYPAWHYPSPPLELPGLGSLPDTTVSQYKARCYWYNIIPSDVLVTDIWPERKVARGDEQVQYLTLVYQPEKRGQYNYNRNYNLSSDSWGGIMRSLGSNATNLAANNYNFIEIWMKIEGVNISNGKLYIDLGRISEKVITDSRVKARSGGLHTEDGITSKSPIVNGQLDEGEDVGMDGLTDGEEKVLFTEFASEADPSGDNYYYSGTGSVDYLLINGQEGNGTLGDIGRLPDTEDLNRNGVLDLSNSYFEYEIPLDSASAVSRKQIVGGGNNGWYQFRIPLNEYKKAIGTPSFDIVESIRLWVTGVSSSVSVKIAQFDIVGNQWQEVKRKDSTQKVVYDSTFKVSVVSIEETPGYTAPPGVTRAKDYTRPDENIEANEQALALILRSLPDGEFREAVRYYTSRPLDVFNYKTMRMFVHGDMSFQYIDTTNYDAEFYFRFGVDTANYYEYRMPLRAGWDPQNNIIIDFAQLTSVKQFQDTTSGRLGFGSIAVTGKEGHRYQIMGRPTLTNIVYFAVGIKNPKSKGTTLPLYGDVWVNELRLSKVNDTPGWALRFDGSLKLSSFGSISFNFSKTSPEFHSVDTRFGNRNDDKNWGVNASFALQNLLPKELSGSSLNVSYSHTESVNDPQYIPGTDILVEEAANQLRTLDSRKADSLRTVSQTIRVSESFALPSIKIFIQSNHWLVQETINKLNFNFNYNKTNDRDPQAQWRKTWSWNFGTSYGTSFSALSSFSPFKSLFDGLFFLDQYKNYKISLLPDISFNFAASRSQTQEKYRIEKEMRKPIRAFTSSRSMSLKWRLTEGGLLNLNTDYSVNVSSSFTHLETDSLGNPRTSKSIFSDILFKNGVVDFGLDNNYDQTININNKLTLPKLFGLEEFFEIQLGDYKVSYKWQNNLSMGNLGKSAGWSNQVQPSFTFKLKTLGDKIFGVSTGGDAGDVSGRRRRSTQEDEMPQPGASVDSAGTRKKINVMEILRTFIKEPFFNFENITINFTQSNQSSNSGIPGTTGFGNLWGRVPFIQGSTPDNGPSRAYQFGLITDPTGKLVNFGTRSRFPFFGFDYVSGIRVPNPRGTLTDNFQQNNSITFGTNRSILQGLTLTLNWKVSWAYNRNSTLQTDTLGMVTSVSKTISSNLERSYMAMPDFFFFKFLGAGGIEKISDIYTKSLSLNDNPKQQSEKMAVAFEQGFEFLPIMTKIFGSIAPRANWSIRWTGLEKIPFLSKFASSVSIDHSYTSNHSKRFRVDPQTGELITESQTIAFNFSPLIGMNISFRDFLGGNFSANLRYSTGKNYQLSSGASSIIEASTEDISVTSNFDLQGLQIPLFGLYLKNDVGISLTVGMNGSGRKTFGIKGNALDINGIADDNSTGTTIEPRFKYTISSKVTGSVYYKYQKRAGARVPGNTTNEAGLDVRISIN